MAHVDEPVVESAPLARWVAERLCRKDASTGSDCSWNHGFWQYLRIFDLATTPAYHAEFIRDAFAAVLDRGRIGILISGAIDYSMLAHALWACRLHGLAAAVTVVDICDTPLFLNHWYARRVGTSVNSVRCDVLEFETAERYDVVCTHALLGEIAPRHRGRLVAKWFELLKPGGVAITVNRIRPQGGDAPASFSGPQAQALRDALMQRSEGLRERLDVSADDLARFAEAYASQRRIYPVRSGEEIETLFRNAGFVVEHFSTARIATPSGDQVSGPTIPRGGEYAHVIARRT